ncbi:MAG: hypothetical protein LAP21_11450 [Acidobacteriia bacterium]|nr:hypothetical protein [Terriglobia bacterium]
MKQSAKPDAGHDHKVVEPTRSRPAQPHDLASAGHLAQLAGMMNGSPRMQSLAQLKAASDHGPRMQGLMEVAAGINPSAPATVSAAAESGRREAGLMGDAGLVSAKAVQIKTEDQPQRLVQLSRINFKPEAAPVIQRQLSWHEGARTKVTNLTGPILDFTDFGVTPSIVNGTEIPPGDAAAALLGPAILFNRLEHGGVEASIHAEPINVISYRMELPSDPPWVRQATVDHASSALEMLSKFSISHAVAPDRDAVITVEAKGLPSDGGFAALVEQHEDVHVRELAEVVHEILLPWDTRIAQFRVQGRKFVGENEVAAAALLYEALGGTAAQVGARFNNALRDRGLAFHHTGEGSSPEIDSTTFGGGILRVYWKHPMG